MTREEAIKFEEHAVNMTNIPEVKEFYRMFAAALRPVSREEVEKMWRGKWQRGTKDWVCSRCGRSHTFVKSFCPNCGAPMTDEAVQMVLERLEAMKNGSTTD